MDKRLYQTILGVVGALALLLSLGQARVAAADEWFAEYFSNATLSGGPAITRYESALSFNWGSGSPHASIPADNFSARFTRDAWFEGGTYRFSYASDDGVRIWVGSTLVVDDWRERAAAWTTVDASVPAGVQKVRIEYYDRTGTASLQVGWEKLLSGATWVGSYYGNQSLSGAPVLTRNDAAIDFDWGNGSPDAKVPADGFSARWSRTLGFEAGTYRFLASTDDGVRIFVDGKRIVDAWTKQSLPNTRSGDIVLAAGQHTIVVEYFEEGGEAGAHVWWNRLDAVSGWEGRYFDNRELRGGPALIRGDAQINFDWGEGSPAGWIPSDNFSVQWVRQINFTPGLYRFNVRADDGMRLWIDDSYIHMDHWKAQDYVWHYQDWHYLEGPHTLRLEYYEAAGGARIQFWWDYAATIPAAQAMAPSPVYGFASAPSSAGVPGQAGAPAVQYPGPWQGEYFAGRDLTKTPALVRTDAAIDFDWKSDAPGVGIPVNQFAVRWTGEFAFEAGTYRFTTTTDDGFRLYIDDRLVLENWRPMRGTRSVQVSMIAGTHKVRLEYFEALEAALARLSWTRVGNAALPVASPAQAIAGPWTIRYYANTGLQGEPALVLADQKVPLDFDWGFDSPAAALPRERFSASFTQARSFAAGRYTFRTYSDDGVRLYVDDVLLINSWRAMRGTRVAALDLAEGIHTLRLEYFEQTGAARIQLTLQGP